MQNTRQTLTFSPSPVFPTGRTTGGQANVWYRLAKAGVGETHRLLLTWGALLLVSWGLSAAPGAPGPEMLLDSLPPPPARKTVPQENFRQSSQEERARTAVILKHTILGTPPPPEEELERQRREKTEQVNERLARHQAMIKDRLERRQERLDALLEQNAAGDSGQLSSKAARKREASLLRAERDRAKALATLEAQMQRSEQKRLRAVAKREARRTKSKAENEKLLARREAKRVKEERQQQLALEARKAKRAKDEQRQKASLAERVAKTSVPVPKNQPQLVAKGVIDPPQAKTPKAAADPKLETGTREDEVKAARLAARQEKKRSREQRKKAQVAARETAERLAAEAEYARRMAQQAEAQRAIETARRLAAEERQREEQKSAAEAQLAQQEYARKQEQERQRAEALRLAAQDAAQAEEKSSGPASGTQAAVSRNAPPVPRLSAVERASIARTNRARIKQQFAEQQRARKLAAQRNRQEQQAARLALQQARWDRRAAQRKAAKDAAADRLAQRTERQNELRQRREAVKAERALRKAKDEAEKNRRAMGRDQRRDERRTLRTQRRAEQLAALEARKAASWAEKAARKMVHDQRRAERLKHRLDRRAERLAKREARRAERMAKRELRRAARLARRAARRLRRQQNPPYWTAEPAVVLGLAARSGGSPGEKSLEAVTVQALAGHHRPNGLSLRAGLAATVINSKVSSVETSTTTVSRTAVVRIIQNPDGSRTEEMGTVQVPQTTIRETRYYNQLTSVDFPVLLGYRLKGNRLGLLLEAGPSLNLSSGGEAHLKVGDTFRAVGGGHFLGRRPGIGFLGMLSGEYKLSENNSIIGGLRIQHFGGSFENPEAASSATQVTTIGLQLGYRLRF